MDKAAQILAGLGGADNIDDIEACITRLRVEVDDDSLSMSRRSPLPVLSVLCQEAQSRSSSVGGRQLVDDIEDHGLSHVFVSSARR